jgi:hypothetical protein
MRAGRVVGMGCIEHLMGMGYMQPLVERIGRRDSSCTEGLVCTEREDKR